VIDEGNKINKAHTHTHTHTHTHSAATTVIENGLFSFLFYDFLFSFVYFKNPNLSTDLIGNKKYKTSWKFQCTHENFEGEEKQNP
jgi:hypothetical protein